MTTPLMNTLNDLQVLLRNQLTDPQPDRGDTNTQTYEASGDTEIAFSKSRVKNVYYVKEEETELTLREQYTPDYYDQKIVSKTDSGFNGTIKMKYDFGSTWIYPDFPRKDATFPRMSVTRISAPETELTIGDGKILYGQRMQITIFSDGQETFSIDNEAYNGPKLVDYLVDEIYKVIRENRKWIPEVYHMRVLDYSQGKETLEGSGEKPSKEMYTGRVDVRLFYLHNN